MDFQQRRNKNWKAETKFNLLKQAFAVILASSLCPFQMAVQHFHRTKKHPGIKCLQWRDSECCPVCSDDRARLRLTAMLGNQWVGETRRALCFLHTAGRYGNLSPLLSILKLGGNKTSLQDSPG